MDLYLFLFYFGTFMSFMIGVSWLFSGIQNSIKKKYNYQLTISALIALVASWTKLPHSYLNDDGSTREQILFFGLFTIQIISLIPNIYAFRDKHPNYYYLIFALILLYLISCYIFIPKFNLLKHST